MLGKLNSKLGNVGKGVFLTGVSTFFSKILILLITVLLARTIDKSMFGQFGLVKRFVDSFSLYTTFGMGITVTRFISVDKKNESVITNIAFSIITLASFCVLILGFIYSDRFITEILNNSISSNVFYSLLITIYLAAIYNLFIGKSFGSLNYIKVFKLQVLLSLLTFISVILSVFYRLSFLLYSIPVSYFVFISLTFKGQIKIKNLFLDIRNNKNSVIDIFKFGWPIFLASSLTAPVLWYVQSLYSINEFKLSELGIYSSIYIIPGFFASISIVINNALMPIIFKYESKKNDVINILSGITTLYFLAVIFISSKEYIFAFIKVDSSTEYINAFIIQISTIIIMTYRQGF